MILEILAAAALFDAASAPVQPTAASSPRPLSNPGSWVTTEDYPVQSLRRGEQGITAFSLEVDLFGEVINCTIVSSSGSATLDQAACYLVSQRATFRPARGPGGKAVAGSYNQRVSWVLPQFPGPAATRIVTSYLVDEKGIVSECKIEEVSGAASDGDEELASGCRPGVQYKPYLDEEGHPVRKRIRTRFEVEELPVK